MTATAAPPGRVLRPVAGLGWAAAALLALTGCYALSTVPMRFDLAEHLADTPVELIGARTHREFVATLVWGLFGLATTGVLIAWTHALRQNARALTGVHLSYGDAWAGLSWVVPVAGLVVPKKVLDEVWALSHPAGGHRPDALYRVRRSWLIRAWWVTWVLGELLLAGYRFAVFQGGQEARSMGSGPILFGGAGEHMAASLDAYEAGYAISGVLAVVTFVSGLLGAAVAVRLTAFQNAAIAAAPPAPPPASAPPLPPPAPAAAPRPAPAAPFPAVRVVSAGRRVLVVLALVVPALALFALCAAAFGGAAALTPDRASWGIAAGNRQTLVFVGLVALVLFLAGHVAAALLLRRDGFGRALPGVIAWGVLAAVAALFLLYAEFRLTGVPAITGFDPQSPVVAGSPQVIAYAQAFRTAGKAALTGEAALLCGIAVTLFLTRRHTA
ncbi:DUF4328 domain-containing protein [Actinomadura macrotermitis]|uniref:DUF4328 domain-containing protein n=1 Tax=Actinomadura macrotermitis TaxID=2585200 RepID=A0A7K0C2Y6_9ACTN|nr:DUF4328 domain-containing protein [Actinomadura macrotermitis]MQY07726.1 hypothetical protein [Actinomadura macrotermitis]